MIPVYLLVLTAVVLLCISAYLSFCMRPSYVWLYPNSKSYSLHIYSRKRGATTYVWFCQKLSPFYLFTLLGVIPLVFVSLLIVNSPRIYFCTWRYSAGIYLTSTNPSPRITCDLNHFQELFSSFLFVYWGLFPLQLFLYQELYPLYLFL